MKPAEPMHPVTAVHMKHVLLLALLCLRLSGFCQDQFSARLSISGGVSELGISPSEEIWVATKAGNVYYTKQVGELWHLGPFGSMDDFSMSVGNTFERINFFSQDTLMISGFIQEDERQDFVLWSGNHGKTWEKVVFGQSSWLDAACINGNGKAWMSGNSQLIYYTQDKGRTWKSFDKVEASGNLRFSTIHFAKDEKTGLFGSFYNVLYLTKDNCKSWEKLPTPLSQNKYQRLSKGERPEFRKVRQLGEYFIVDQQGKVFISKSDKIDWQRMNDIIEFEVTESGNLYTINKHAEIQLLDSRLNSIWKAPHKMEGYIRAIGVKHESLFILTGSAIYKINRGKFLKSDLYTNEASIAEPYEKVYHRGLVYGVEGSDLLTYDNTKRRWIRLVTADFPIGNATSFNNQLIISDGTLNNYYSVDLQTKAVNKFELPKSLFDLSANPIEEFHIEIGSQGCFHADNRRRSYFRKGTAFELNKNKSESGFLSNAPSRISEDQINKCVTILDDSRFKKVTVSDLGLTDTDIGSFKHLVDNESKRIRKSGVDRFDHENLYNFPGENADFTFYQKAADSIASLSPDLLDKVFWGAYGNWSTTTEWRRIIFVFKDKTKLIVQNSDDKPNYLFTPWTVDYEGLKFRTNSITFGQTISDLTSGSFFGKTAGDKTYAIFKITDYLYRAKLQSAD
ncbi:MAG: YCF48-related protein [Chryseolinea sp.]